MVVSSGRNLTFKRSATLPAGVAMGAQAMIHRWVGVERLVQNNEIAGFKFATVGVIYAVLLAFTVIAVWEKFSEAENAVAQEAGATASLFRYTEGKEPEALALAKALADYVKTAVETEWPAMARKSESREATRALNEVYRAALALNRAGSRSDADMAEVFAQLDNVTTAAAYSACDGRSSATRHDRACPGQPEAGHCLVPQRVRRAARPRGPSPSCSKPGL